MTKYFLALFFLISTITPSFAEPVIKISPSKVFQGNHMVIEVQDEEKKLNNLTATINKNTIKLVKIKDGSFICYFGFPADLKPEKYSLEITNEDNKEIISSSSIELKEKKQASQNISYYKPKLKKEEEAKIKQEDELVEKAKKTLTEKQFWDSPFIFPVSDSISGVYGIKRYLNGKYNKYHTGTDFASDFGAKIKASNTGKVVLARYFSKYNSNGNLVYIDHGLGVGTVYLHLSKILVKEGDIVKKGQIIGLVGSSGRSTGPHLHWGVYLNGQNTDGVNWVKFTKESLKK